MSKGEKKLVLVKPAEVALTNEVIALAKRTYFKEAPEPVIALALHLCQRYGLDPLAREVMVVQRVKDDPNSWTPMVGRDGFLGIAHQNPLFDGMSSVVIKDEAGVIIGATATVYRKDWKHPMVVTVETKEYNSGYAVWRSKPGTMIQKVAESQALRKAFRIHGVYSEEEMDLAPTPETTKELPTPKLAPVADAGAAGPNPLDTTINAGPHKGQVWRDVLGTEAGRAFWNAAFAVAVGPKRVTLQSIWAAWCDLHPECLDDVSA